MGLAYSMYNSNWPPKAKWGVNDIPDLSGKVILVTGGNSGIGKETVKALLNHKAKVYIAGHSKERCEAAIQELKTQTGSEALFLHLDLASLNSVKAAAEEFQRSVCFARSKDPSSDMYPIPRRETRLDVLINNGGVMMPNIKAVTKDGYDQQFGVNVVGHFYFTKLLLPVLFAAKHPRVVNLTSAGHLLLKKDLDYETFKDCPKREKTDLLELYNQSKFANVVVAKEFARRYGDQGIVSTSLHPGLIVTNLGRDMNPTVVKIVGYLSYTADKGALTTLYAATAPESADANGKYFLPWGRIGNPHPGTQDVETGRKLWEWLESETSRF
ncbi:short-chain alcohol dehydrogenase [Marasmius tenuissimus]|nr:short-chain alcohol dehydrogenase [Marasmius tenuissimus]